jgi:LysM repeat protein
MIKRRNLLLGFFLLILLATTAGTAFADTTYTVRSGDTLYSIAILHGVTVQDIATANHLINPNLIFPGQALIIPGVSNPGEDTGSVSPAPAPAPAPLAGTYVVQSGDTLYHIALTHNVTVAIIVEANGLPNPNLIFPGQALNIPGGTNPIAPPVGPPSTPNPSPPPAPVGVNLLPNSSFEEGFYNLNGVPELHVPNGWHLEIDEAGTAPGTGLPFLRPESRVMPRWHLPAVEHPLFIYDGDWTLKIFKGHAPTSFRLLVDVHLEPGTYQFTAGYFPDLVIGYSGSQKIWATAAAAGETAFIQGGQLGSWSPVTVGTKNSMAQTFTVTSAGAVRLGVAFRTRYAIPNNGFFLDAWSLQRLSG